MFWSRNFPPADGKFRYQNTTPSPGANGCPFARKTLACISGTVKNATRLWLCVMTNDEMRELRSNRLPKTPPAASDGASFAAHPFRALNSKGGVRCEPRSQASSEVIIPRARNGNEGGCHLAHGSHALGTRVVPATSANPFAKRFSLARVRSPN